MSRFGWLPFGIVVVFLVGLGVVALFYLTDDRETLAEATSPDGTWSVAVLARPRFLSGAYDITVEARDAQGQPTSGGFVVDLTRDLDAARKAHAVKFVDNNTAMVGNRTIAKPPSLRN
jgi:hypothetical protein